MNQDIELSKEKQAALHHLIAAIRISHNATDIMDEAFARLLGINRTDNRCIDIIQRRGRITAGQLAHESGLTTGAVTTAIDRLEAMGYVQRTRDTEDRRKVFLEITELTSRLGEVVYAQVGEIGAKGMAGMPIEDMVLVTRFLRTSAALNRKMSTVLNEYADDAAKAPAERLLAAKNYAARIRREAEDLRAQMIDAWNGEIPDEPSGKHFDQG